MRRAFLILAGLVPAACASNLGAPSEISLPTVAIRSDRGTSAAEVAGAIRSAGARVALVAGPADESWFQEVAAAADLELNGPATAGDLGLGFLAMEALGDTVIELTYPDGRFVVMDALYEVEDERYLDLLAFRVDRPEQARPIVASLLRYAATDVMPSAAVVMAVAVPTVEVGDSVAAMFSPGYFEAVRCEGGPVPTSDRGGIRLFHGPEARIFCRGAEVERTAAGEVIRARLVMGRR